MKFLLTRLNRRKKETFAIEDGETQVIESKAEIAN